MRLQIASDLWHQYEGEGLATARPLALAGNVDYLILAGSIHTGAEMLRLYGSFDAPVLFVHGCGELRGRSPAGLSREFRKNANHTVVHYLERGVMHGVGIRFLGCCLWSDYAGGPLSRAESMGAANRTLIDHRVMTREGKLFRAEDAFVEHIACRDWLRRCLVTPFSGPTVVVTHFAPSYLSVPKHMRTTPTAAWHASSLDDLVRLADVWIHGRIPNTVDYMIDSTRVVCNARGLPRESTFPRRQFEPGFTIEV
jgi:hypothetical protein